MTPGSNQRRGQKSRAETKAGSRSLEFLSDEIQRQKMDGLKNWYKVLGIGKLCLYMKSYDIRSVPRLGLSWNQKG